MMGKGGYHGGGTVVSPITNPDWFGDGGPRGEDGKVKGPHPEPGTTKTTRNQRKKRAKDRYRAKMPGVAKPKPQFSDAEQNRIDKLKIEIVGLQREIAKLSDMLERDRKELLELVKKYDLPADKYPLS